MTKNNDIKEAKEDLEKLNGDYEMQRLAELREKAIRDEASALDFATQKSLKQGLEQGFNQGKNEEKISIAKKLLKLGLSIDNIAKTTDLAHNEILKLKNENIQ